MSLLTFSVPHSLGQAEAERRLQKLFPQLEQKYSGLITLADYTWQGNRCDFKLTIHSFKIGGALTVEDQLVRIELDLPLAGLFFKDKIQQTIQQQAQVLLGPGPKSS